MLLVQPSFTDGVWWTFLLILISNNDAYRKKRSTTGSGVPYFNLKDPEHSDYVYAIESGQFGRYDSKQESPSYFRILDVFNKNLIVGGADAIHNISIDSFEAQPLWRLEANSADKTDCLMGGNSPEECRNFIRVFVPQPQGNFLICGTNAYKPMCQILDRQADNEYTKKFSGIGISPFDPKQNYSFSFDHGTNELYTSTMADFSGNFPLIYRLNITNPSESSLKTQPNMLNEHLHFVGAINSNEFVYFFFRELAIEDAGNHYSRVARICKSDKGGTGHSANVWTSFVKARLNCSIPGRNRPFYFDELVSISQLYNINGRRIVYATFASEFDFIRQSVICAFDLDQIDEHFRTSSYFANEQNKWVRKWRQNVQTQRIGQCQQDSRSLTDDEIAIVRKYNIISETIPNIFNSNDRTIGIHRNNDLYNSISVMHGVEFSDGTIDVIYVSTDHGTVIKMINLASSTSLSIQSEDRDPLIKIAVYELSNHPIRHTFLPKDDKQALMVVTDSELFKIPIQFCGKYKRCDECIGSRDPHCYWHRHDNKCIYTNTSARENTYNRTDIIYQDVLRLKHGLCEKISSLESIKQKPVNEQVLAPNAEVCSCTISQNINGCNCNVTKDSDQQFLLLETSTDNSPHQEFPIDFPWWVLLILGIAIIQTIMFTCLCTRYLITKRRRSKKVRKDASDDRSNTSSASTSTLQLQYKNYSQFGVINAYSPPPPAVYPKNPSDQWMMANPSRMLGAAANSRSSPPQSDFSSRDHSSPSGSTSKDYFSSGSDDFQPKSIRGLLKSFVSRPLLMNSSSPARAARIKSMKENSAGDIKIHLEGSATPSAVVIQEPQLLSFPRC